MYRIDVLLKNDQKLFHTSDLALLWHIKNTNTLYTTITRYVKKGILFRIHKGFYSTFPIEKINPLRLAIGYLHTYAYLSTETVLAQAGVIFQKGNYLTLVSNQSKKFSLGCHNFMVRKMREDFLHQPNDINESDGLPVADPERAAADLLYFDPKYHFDNPQAIDWVKVKKIQKEVFHL